MSNRVNCKTKRNCQALNHVEKKIARKRNGGKDRAGENKNDNFAVKLSLLFNSENSIIHR